MSKKSESSADGYDCGCGCLILVLFVWVAVWVPTLLPWPEWFLDLLR